MRFIRSGISAAALAWAVVAVHAAPVEAAVVPPTVRALELPAGAVSLSADDPLLAAVLNGATSTVGGQVVHDAAGKTFPIGKTLVTWRDLSNNATLARYVFLYPHGYQVLGPADNLRVFEHNGARHLLYDHSKRVHAIYSDGTAVWYRLAVRNGNRLHWRDPVQVNDSATAIAWSTLGTRGQTFAMTHDASGHVVLQCVWSSNWPDNRSILTRRLTVDAAGNVTAGDIVDTGLTGSFQCIAADSTGRMHLAVELYSAIVYSQSDDGLLWSPARNWPASQTGCLAYRFPNLAVDSHDRLHLLWQAEGYQGYQGSKGRGLWWTGLYAMYQPATATWTSPVNVLSGLADWSAPAGGQQMLFAYPNLLIDDQDNLHLAWHGTAYSRTYAMDDTFYLEKVYNPAAGTWSAWMNYATLHRRDHANNGLGEDANFSWVPSLAYRPATGDLYAVVMFGTDDDEVSNPAINLTDSLLKVRTGGGWQAGYQNVTQTAGLRSWYGNVPPEALVDPNGHVWLDLLWVDGTLAPDGSADYHVLFRRLDMGGPRLGDIDGDGRVDAVDLAILAGSWAGRAGQGDYNAACDLNGDGRVDILDLLALAAEWEA